MSNEEQVADTIEMLYERLNSYNKQDLFNYGYLLESYEILYKDIEEKDNEIERLNNIIEVQKSKLLMIKGIINTPRALDSSLAYVMVKSHIQEVLNGSLGIDIGSDKE